MKKYKLNLTGAIKISLLSVLINLLLSVIKLAAGILGHSQALVADAVHSASDVLSTFIVIAALFIAQKKEDAQHEYGHQKYESLTALFLAIFLAVIGLGIGRTGVTALMDGSYKTAQLPSVLAAVAAAASILVKEIMFRITMATAKKENSSALKADAWHHRSDALSSIGSLIGVGFALLGFPIADPIASLIICVFILKSTVEIGMDAIKSLTDSSCDEETKEKMRQVITSTPGVSRLDLLKTRTFGSGYYVDIEIATDGSQTLSEAHEIARAVHDQIEKEFPLVLHCMVHVNPINE